MLKKIYNEAVIEFEFSPDQPILIKSGSQDVQGPDMTFVKTRRNGIFEPFVPGSSLKGVLRSYSEKIARTINDQAACMPHFLLKDSESNTPNVNYYVSCGEVFNIKYRRTEPDTFKIYKDSCPICKTFGSNYFIGRLETEDAYLVKEKGYQLEERDGVGIDRFTGGASNRAKFELEVLTSGTFTSKIRIRNFEIWQLTLTIISLNDFLSGFVRIGYGKSRGLGKIKGNIKEVAIYYFGQNVPEQKELKGIGAFLDDNECSLYGYKKDDVVENMLDQKESFGFRSKYLLKDIDAFINSTAKNLHDYLANWRRPSWMIEEIENYKKDRKS